MHLLQDFHGGRQRLGEHRSFIWDRIRDRMQVAKRQDQSLGEGPMLIPDAEDTTPFAVRGFPAPAGQAFTTGKVDLSHNPFSQPA